MWPFRSRFEKALLAYARILPVRHPLPDDEEDASWSISVDENGDAASNPTLEGYLCALVFAQAQSDGATRVRFCTGSNSMFYTVNAVDYEMVPAPANVTAAISRRLARTTKVRPGAPGMIRLSFADLDVVLYVDYQPTATDPHIEITGFTGERMDCDRHLDPRHADQLTSQKFKLMLRLVRQKNRT